MLFLAMLALTSPAFADDPSFGMFWQAQPSHWIEAGKQLYSEEIGKPVGDAEVLVAYVDVNDDTIGDILVYPINPALCGQPVCAPRLYTFVDATYRERIGELSDATKVGPGDIDVSSIKRGGYRDLSFGAETLYWVDGAYRPWSTVEPTAVSDDGFVKACSQDTALVEVATNIGADDPAAAVGEYCRCVSYQLALRQHGQGDFDAVAANIAETGVKLRDSLLTSYGESVSACRVLQGWEPWPQPDTFPSRRIDARAFYNACAHYEDLIQSYRIGSPHRAMAFCGCFAEAITRQDFDQSSVDLLAGFYAQDISDAEVDEKVPRLLEQTDAIAERCINDLRHADYVNRIDRPGSPTPPKD